MLAISNMESGNEKKCDSACFKHDLDLIQKILCLAHDQFNPLHPNWLYKVTLVSIDCNVFMNFVKEQEVKKIEGHSGTASRSSSMTEPDKSQYMSNCNRLLAHKIDTNKHSVMELSEKHFLKSETQKTSEKRVKVEGVEGCQFTLEQTNSDIQQQKITGAHENFTFRLKKLVLRMHIYEWQIIANQLKCEKQVVISHWQKVVYPSIALKTRVAGSAKWAGEEDSILFGYVKKNGFDWDSILVFLPARTIFSIEGRWRRLSKNQTVVKAMAEKFKKADGGPEKFMCKHQFRKHIIRKIAEFDLKMNISK